MPLIGFRWHSLTLSSVAAEPDTQLPLQLFHLPSRMRSFSLVNCCWDELRSGYSELRIETFVLLRGCNLCGISILLSRVSESAASGGTGHA